MNYSELIAAIKHLSVQERLALLEVLARSLQEELAQPEPAGSSLARVRGLARPGGPLPTDEDLKDAYTDYLIEKYS